MVIPTLVAGDTLAECLRSLSSQTLPNFEIVVVDNSGKGLVRKHDFPGIAIIEMEKNVGFGAAINKAYTASDATYLATLNDDAVASPQWLAALVFALDQNPEAGLCASQVRLYGENVLDSAGMSICADGSSKQRGHRQPPLDFSKPERVLMPSASAALYRTAMLREIGAFDGDFFLYCEDTDLGLRAARAGWHCLYVPEAVVEHRYSHSAGRVSPLKAYYVERNRIFVAVKNFPSSQLVLVPFVAIARYWWHLLSIFRGTGTAAAFRSSGQGGWQLIWFVSQGSCRRSAASSNAMAQKANSASYVYFGRRRIQRPSAALFNFRAGSSGPVRTPIAPAYGERLLVLVPAFNEEGAIAGVVRSVQANMPGVPVLVIDDCSADTTCSTAEEAGAHVVTLPHHLGLGGCVQTGYKLAFEAGYEFVIRVDGDGQHDARDIPRVFETLKKSGYEMVIGSRFIEKSGQSTGQVRSIGIVFFRAVLRPILGQTVHDPTSGFVGVNRRALAVFGKSFPLEYPEIEALVVLQRRRFRFVEVPCTMLPRTTGRSSITALKSVYYIVHVLLGVLVNVLKYEGGRLNG